MELTSLDLSFLMQDIGELEGGHVQKVYQRGDELTVEVYVGGEGKKRLIIGPSYCYLTNYKRDNPTKPPGFCMELRKHLGKIDSIKQRGFDRILEIKSGDHRLIAEMFGKGNLILVNNGEIARALNEEEWADRTIKVGEDYRYPEPATDPREAVFENAVEDGEIVRELASKLSLGGIYAEEICARAGVDKNTPVEDLDREELENVKSEFENLLSQDPKPVLYIDELPERAAPFPLETFSGYEEESFESFSRAVDELFYRRQKQENRRKQLEAFREKKQKLEHQEQQQERKIEGLETAAEENREKAELIYTEYNELEQLKQMLEEAVEEHGWKETQEMLKDAETEAAEKVNSVNEQEEFFSVKVKGFNLKLKPGEDLEAAASRYYDKAKESEQKMEKAREALEQTREELRSLDREDVEVKDLMEDKTEKRSKKWFEKYRWFYTSNGFLVIAGRDVQTNEMAVKKHMEDRDLYFHADFDGAPSVILKDGKEAEEIDREEAAKAAVTFTKTWKAGIGADDAYYVEPSQVTEEPEPGEYLPEGAFVVRGDREYMHNVATEAAIGPYRLEEDVHVPMCGPEAAVRSNCEKAISLRPGHTKKSEIAKEIRKRFREDGYDLDLDYIIRALPPGKSEIDS
ncbi:MAG: ribosome rescue protein RqcH [Candidatus Nanohaloarchaea archaeon]